MDDSHLSKSLIGMERPTAREIVYQDIDSECNYQNKQWNTKFDDKNTINDWVTYICRCAGKAAFPQPNTPIEIRRQLIKVAALAVGIIETFDKNKRMSPRHYDLKKQKVGKLIDLTGQRIGKWLVLKRAPNSVWDQTMWHCRCDCGREQIVRGNNMRKGNSMGCKYCYMRRIKRMHGKDFTSSNSQK